MSSLSSRITAKNVQAESTSGTGGNGGTVNVSGSAVTLDTVAALNSATIDPSVNYVRVAGYHTLGDPGSGPYKRKVTGDPDLPGDQTSNGGTVGWTIVVESDRLSLWRFGARDMINYLQQPAPGDPDDIYPALVAMDKWMRNNNNVIQVNIGPGGIFYQQGS